MTSKQRAYLKGLAMKIDPIFQIGKSSVTPELTEAIAEALEARELIKINILKNCLDEGNSVAAVLAERTRSEVVQVIGRKIVLCRKPGGTNSGTFIGGLNHEKNRHYGRNIRPHTQRPYHAGQAGVCGVQSG